MKGLFNMKIFRRWFLFFLKAVKEQKKYFCLSIILAISISLLGSLTTIITGSIMNSVQQFPINDIKRKVVFMLIFLLSIQAISMLCSIIHSNISLKSNYELKKYTSKLYVGILNKIDYLKMCKIDYSKSLDIISRELIGNTCINDFMILFTSFFSTIVSFFIIGNYTFHFNIWLFLTLLVIFILSLLTGIIRSKIYLNKRNSLMKDIREENYLASLANTLSISREFFFFPIKKVLFDKWKRKFKSNNAQLVKEKNKGELFNVSSIFIIIIFIFLYLFLIEQNKINYLFGTFFIVLLSILNISNNIIHLGIICNRFYVSAKNLSEIDKLDKDLENLNMRIRKNILI